LIIDDLRSSFRSGVFLEKGRASFGHPSKHRYALVTSNAFLLVAAVVFESR